MKMIPLFHSGDMARSIDFYTRILDFTFDGAGVAADDPVIILNNGEAELMISTIDGLAGNAANVVVSDIDELFKKYLERGLDQSSKKESPVHQQPVDQTWGTREFYVTDPDGNTLRFRQQQ